MWYCNCVFFYGNCVFSYVNVYINTTGSMVECYFISLHTVYIVEMTNLSYLIFNHTLTGDCCAYLHITA